MPDLSGRSYCPTGGRIEWPPFRLTERSPRPRSHVIWASRSLIFCNDKTVLQLPAPRGFRLKRRQTSTVDELRPAVLVAQRLPRLVLARLHDMPAFGADLSALEIRTAILQASEYVDLGALIHFSWSRGVAVIHIPPGRLPRGVKKFHGLAMFCDNTPVIVLGSGQDSPPWLAYHLAHELGEIFTGHVRPGDQPLVDSEIDRIDNDKDEQEADEFATTVLTGKPHLGFFPKYGLTGPKLALAAAQYGGRHGIEPCTVALMYARSANRWGPSQIAIKEFGQDSGAHEIINHQLITRIQSEDLPESTARFLNALLATAD